MANVIERPANDTMRCANSPGPGVVISMKINPAPFPKTRHHFRSERLGETPFICGEQFTGADIVMAHNVSWARS